MNGNDAERRAIARSVPQTQFIQLSDSESDIGELLAEAAEFADNYGFIIRHCRTQKIVAAVDALTGLQIEGVATIDEALSKVSWCGEKTVAVGGREAPVLPDDSKRTRNQARTSREALVQFSQCSGQICWHRSV